MVGQVASSYRLIALNFSFHGIIWYSPGNVEKTLDASSSGLCARSTAATFLTTS